MPYKYLLINSQEANQRSATRPYKSSLEIHLNQPIERAVSMQMMSFSSPNDFFNVRAHNDTFECMLYSLSGTPALERKTYTLETGLFTIQEIVNSLNAKAAESPFGTMQPVFNLSASNKVQITCSSTGTGIRRFVLYSTKFHNSIVHRLGFNEHQVFTRDFSPEAAADWNNTSGGPLLGPDKLFNYISGQVFVLNTPEASWKGTIGNALVWKTDGTGETKNGNNIGFENYMHLLMKCSLVSQDFQSVVKQEDGTILVQSDSVLQKIDTTVSTYSYLHWAAGINQPFVHTLSGKNIQSFSLQLTDDQGQPFAVNESKNWTAVIRFETAEENKNATTKNFLQNQQLRFQASHNCSN